MLMYCTVLLFAEPIFQLIVLVQLQPIAVSNPDFLLIPDIDIAPRIFLISRLNYRQQ